MKKVINYLKLWRLKKRARPGKLKSPGSSGRVVILDGLYTSIIPFAFMFPESAKKTFAVIFGYTPKTIPITRTEIFYLYAAVLGMFATGAIRFIRSLDSWSVGKKILGAENIISRLVYRKLDRTLLCQTTLNRIGLAVDSMVQQATEATLKAKIKTETYVLSLDGLPVSSRAAQPNVVQPKTQVSKTDSVQAPEITGESEEIKERRNRRTVYYIQKRVNPKRRLSHLVRMFLLLVGTVKMFTGLGSGKPLTASQMVGRIGGVGYGLLFGISQLDAYVQLRAKENPPKPFFLIADKFFRRIPIRRISRWILGRAYSNIKAIENGNQPFGWRMQAAAYEKLPNFFLKRMLIHRLERNKFVITPEVLTELRELGCDVYLDNLRKAVEEGQMVNTSASVIRLGEAYRSLLRDTSEQATTIGSQFELYRNQVTARSQIYAQAVAAMQAIQIEEYSAAVRPKAAGSSVNPGELTKK